MTFTDDDLKRLKGYAAENIEAGRLNWDDLRGLLARLEAAESWGHHGLCGCDAVNMKTILDCSFYQAWRKAAGK